MTLASGAHVGPYEVVDLLGAGGMGEVYRATDTKLKRQVAIKVLPASLADDSDRLARFQREAEMLARLNHPHIAQVHGIEDSTHVKALVMELVEGPTLADRIAAGPIPLDEALSIARQIAEALETAHEQGVVHRDLKPANIKLRTDGTVKVLDFGLAKAMGSISAMSPGQSVAQTITTPAMTQAGVILGTAAYMSPEQAAGKATDRRADIFSFGAVLYEMLTGRRTFDGDSVSETVASVLKVDPDWNALPPSTPSAIRRLIQRCLAKDKNQRLQAIGEARIVLQHPTAEEPTPTRFTQPARRGWAIAAVASALLLIAALGLLAFLYTTRPASQAAQAMRLSVLLPDEWQLSIANRQGVPTSLMISPNGKALAMVARRSNGPDTILVRLLDSPVAQPLMGTEGVGSMFWSPDSRFLGFYANGKLMKIDVSGGPPLTLSEVPTNFGGGTWNQEGIVVFSSLGTGNYVLRKVSADGGTPTDVWPASAINQAESRIRPSFLPDGRHLLFAAVAAGRAGGATIPIEIGSLDSTDHVEILSSGSTNTQYAQGHLLYLRESTLMAQPFDAERLATTGEAVPIAEQVQRQGVQPPYGIFSASVNGVLVYQTGTNIGSSGGTQLTWIDRKGAVIRTVSEPGNYSSVALSPDGRRAVVGEIVPLADLWTVDLARGVKTRLTFGSTTVVYPVWSPDGSRIAFASPRNGQPNIYIKAANGTGGEDALVASDTSKIPSDWSADGRYLLFQENAVQAGGRLMALPMEGERKPFLVFGPPFYHFPAALSPDGRWLAYTSNESSRPEIYVTPFTPPDGAARAADGTASVTGGKQQVSPGGGDFARWRRDGREIYYVSPPPTPTLMAAAVSAHETSFSIDSLTPLFRVNPNVVQGFFYDVAPDGQRFLFISPVQVEAKSATEPPTILLNWVPRVGR